MSVDLLLWALADRSMLIDWMESLDMCPHVETTCEKCDAEMLRLGAWRMTWWRKP